MNILNRLFVLSLLSNRAVSINKAPIIAAMRISNGILQFGLCVSFALTGSTLARAQDAVPGTLGDLSKRTEATPTVSTENPGSKPSLEISAATTNKKPAPIVKQTPSAEELAAPAATVKEDRPRVRRGAIVPPQAPQQLRRHWRPQKVWRLAPRFPIIHTKRGVPMLLAAAFAS